MTAFLRRAYHSARRSTARFFQRHFFLGRLFQLVFILLGVTFFTFIVTSAAPSDAAEMYYLSRGITPSETLLASTRAEMGLDAPVLVRYLRWLISALQGDLGQSYQFSESVLTQLSRKLPATLILAGGALVLALAVAFPIGILCAVKKDRIPDVLFRVISLGGISLPNFWLALILLYVFAVQLHWFPVIGSGDLKSMVLPAMTLAIPLAGSYIRQIRTATLEELGKEYVSGLRAKGIPSRTILFRHVLPGLMLPMITLISLSAGHLLGGAAIVETIFGWPGIGSMVVDSIRVRDYPVIQGYVIWMAVIYLLTGLFSDAVCRLLDPQFRASLRIGRHIRGRMISRTKRKAAKE